MIKIIYNGGLFMIKRFYLSIACTLAVCSLFASNANEEIARGEERSGGGHHDEHHNYNHNNEHRNDEHRNDFNRNDGHHGYDRYENHNLNPNAYYNRYDQNRWNNRGTYNGGAYDEGIIDGVLLNNTYNPDVQYTQPGSTDNFNQVYEQNLQ